MSKLLRAGYRRCFRNILFWIALAASALLGFASGARLKESAMLDDMYVIFGFLIFAAFMTLMIIQGLRLDDIHAYGVMGMRSNPHHCLQTNHYDIPGFMIATCRVLHHSQLW